MGKEPTGSLRKGCLNFTELTSVAIALISPTMTAALIVPLMYSSAGNASWLAYLFGTVMLLFVALNLNQFARRSTSAGSMFAYTVMGLGTTAGGISGWCLVWAYLFIGTAGMTGFTIFANTLFGMMGFQLPNIVIFAGCAAIIWFLARRGYRNFQPGRIRVRDCLWRRSKKSAQDYPARSNRELATHGPVLC